MRRLRDSHIPSSMSQLPETIYKARLNGREQGRLLTVTKLTHNFQTVLKRLFHILRPVLTACKLLYSTFFRLQWGYHLA